MGSPWLVSSKRCFEVGHDLHIRGSGVNGRLLVFMDVLILLPGESE